MLTSAASSLSNFLPWRPRGHSIIPQRISVSAHPYRKRNSSSSRACELLAAFSMVRTENMDRLLEGGCQCGAVRYRYRGEVLNLFVCRNTGAQKQSGSACAMGLWIHNDGLVLRLSGELR